MKGGNLMSIKNSDAFLDDIISEIQKMKADPEKDTVARVLTMVFRVARKHKDHTSLKKSFLIAAMGLDGIDPEELEILKKWDEESNV
jgi:hypothetical protein